MLIAGFPAGPWGTNCYVVATGPGNECIVVDPGKDAADGVAEVVREHKLKPVSVLVTHGHIDHMWCVAPVAGSYDATAWIHPADRHLLYITSGDGGCADDQNGQLGLAVALTAAAFGFAPAPPTVITPEARPVKE